ncbi:glycine betaine/proline transport system substrate-binding protein [Gracilibacillus ureilyticus]|uniref:Glycine betaine/proline transport system substrate-binding protein n=1 Tax=Gracilibacillus ureilyticus TaxID=531814 RepID=A0A1H9PUU1_9BACI|nr:glycine betaine ABC transporter substrate-binding protein [Gracilibacillus ureilyticus]SER51383.1 glycine betaine/proline transport system substrate-binding protein [Gracilibacillus ureilyticus]
MLKNKWRILGFASMLALVLVLAACGGSDDSEDTAGSEETETEEAAVGEGKEIELVYVNWDSEIASTHVVGKVFEDLGYDVKVTALDNAAMWEAVANGEADGMVAAWLPGTHGDLYEAHKDALVDLGENLSGAKIGLVVPSYMDINSIADLPEYAEELDQKITGIDAGAGVVQSAEQAVEDYALEGWEVQTSTGGAMTTALGEAIDAEEPIVVTGWTPHWKFAEYDLKYLEDPEQTFGGEEYIATMVRQGLEEDLPSAYKVLDQFNWTTEDMESVMLEISNGADPEEAAAAWVEENQELVSEWTAGIE